MMPKELENITFFAFRYALGRRTAAPSVVCDFVTEHWSELPQQTQRQMADEAVTAIKRGEAGSDCDVEEWLRIPKLAHVHTCECRWILQGWSYIEGCEWHSPAAIKKLALAGR
jgi:hypothetical protein